VFINLVRLGFEQFHIADPDTYERTNINRQRLAKEPNNGRRKDECLIEEARAINPDVRIRAFGEGVQTQNLGEFLHGLDWVVDVVDLFAMSQKLALNVEARHRGIPVVSCAAVGFIGSVVVFTRETPSFAELSGIAEGQPGRENFERYVRFIAPELPSYMADQVHRAMDGSTHIPFVVPGVEISAALAATAIAKQVLGMGKLTVAPRGMCFDPIEMRAHEFVADYRTRSMTPPTGKSAG
jgi:molybdopterin-synthase adenylyltransferase